MLMTKNTVFRSLGKEPVAMENPCLVLVLAEVLPCHL
jgi:hypothetical protein